MFLYTDFGKPISSGLSEILREFTSKKDEADISRLTEISISTIRDVKHRNNSLTENNSVAIIELIKVAIRNCDELKDSSLKAKKTLLKMLNPIPQES